MTPKRRRLFSLLVLLLAALLVWLAHVPILSSVGGFLIHEDAPRKSDVVVVLGGDRYGDRTIRGAELAKLGFAPVVYVSGPPRLMGFESNDEIQFAEQSGFPQALFREIHLPANAASSTRTEAQFLGQYLQAQGVHTILLVTSNFHTRRAGKLWRAENPQFQITVCGSRDPHFTAAGWWKSREGQKIFVYEWMKTIAVMFGI